jgi:hypothetical protein
MFRSPRVGLNCFGARARIEEPRAAVSSKIRPYAGMKFEDEATAPRRIRWMKDVL